MCGRYVLASSLAELSAIFGASVAHDGLWKWQASWNIAPASVVPVVALNGTGLPSIVPMRWGLHPHWRKEMPTGRPLFNARLETAFEKPSFRTPWRKRRALIPVQGWYEWDQDTTPKTPFFISPKDQFLQGETPQDTSINHEGNITALCGLWDQYRVDEGITLLTMTILTEPARGPIKHIHHRMPVMLSQTQWQNWLDPEIKPDRTMQHRLDGEHLQHHEVSSVVNSGRAQGGNLILPVVD